MRPGPVAVASTLVLALSYAGCGSTNVSNERAVPVPSTTFDGTPTSPAKAVTPAPATASVPPTAPLAPAPAPPQSATPAPSPGGVPSGGTPQVGGKSVPDD